MNRHTPAVIASLSTTVFCAPLALAQPGCPEAGTVLGESKISATAGGFTGGLDIEDSFGYSVAALGDVDGDGITDLAVGAIGDDDGNLNAGAVWIVFLNADGSVKGQQKISALQGGLGSVLDPDDGFGFDVGDLGDLDGDGVPDLVVGAAPTDTTARQQGVIYVLFLNADGTVKAQQRIGEGRGGFGGALGERDFFGNSVANLGDVDGDGVTDIAVGQFFDSAAGADASGAVWILFMNTTGTVKDEVRLGNGTGGLAAVLEAGDNFGSGVAGPGDLDDDGVPDVIVGARRDDDGGTDRGAMYVIYLNPDGTVKAERKISDGVGGLGLPDSSFFGDTLGMVPDLDGDGRREVAVHAPLLDGAGVERGGYVTVFLNEDESLKGAVTVTDAEGGFGGTLDDVDRFGRSPVDLGDLDGDGRPEISVGALRDDDGQMDAGALWILDLATCSVPPTATLLSGATLLDYPGGMVTLEATGDGTDPLMYQWRRDGIDLVDGPGISGATTPTLELTVGPDDEGLYDVVVTNAFGSDTSDAAIVAVRPNPCPADFDGDGSLTIFDFLAFQSGFAVGCP